MMNPTPRILLTATLRWPLAARLAIAFADLGCAVEAWCPGGHPLEKTRSVRRVHRSSATHALRSLCGAITLAAPDLILPCDDDAALQLGRLHRGLAADSTGLRRLIENSLGAPASCERATRRADVAALAHAQGVRTPQTLPLETDRDIEHWDGVGAYPALVKRDGSWGGLGVSIVRNPAQARAAAQRARQPSAWRAAAHFALRRDLSHLKQWWGPRPALTMQRLVAGVPANRAIACWRGEVLAGISVVALQTRSTTGPASVVRVVDHAEMEEASRRMVRALGLSGLCGLDFIIDDSDAAWLLEVNPRATPICHLALGPGRDLPGALRARLVGTPVPATPAAVAGEVIAMFPGEWARDPLSPYLQNAFHDVPWAEIELVRECVDRPWEERGWLARLRAGFDPSSAAPIAPFPWSAPAAAAPRRDPAARA
ncbi:MAG TPA: ATP-grasp domain-containing protein [Verrucomicrobiae bacterium]|nr:ATP-grasp domain-containing protein [Verrucomicrobiae bacterium]